MDRISISQLPPGKTCKDCAHATRCVWYLGHSFSYDSTECDWGPSRFRDDPKQSTEPGTK
jgi:hypothetical protein